MKRRARTLSYPAATAAQQEARGKGTSNPTVNTSRFELNAIQKALQRVLEGDFSVRLPRSWTGLAGHVAGAFNRMASTNQQIAGEIQRVSEALRKRGRTRERIKLHASNGSWGEIERALNKLLDDWLRPTAELTRAIAAATQEDPKHAEPPDPGGPALEEELPPQLLRAKMRIFAELQRKNQRLERQNLELEGRVEERTRELQRSANLLELATEAVIVRDWQGQVEFWNAGAENMYGWKREEMLGKMLHEVLKTRFPVTAEDVAAELTGSGRWEGNLVQATREGKEITVAVRKVVQCDDSGAPLAVLEIGRDITGRLQTEEALRRSERLAAMGRMAGIIAHEINNPLEAITNALYLVREHPSLDDDARRYARLADKELARVAEITSKTLGFYREAKAQAPTKVTTVLDEILELEERSLRRANVHLERDYRMHSAVTTNPAELKQVFLNLIGNAMDAMPRGGKLRVRLRDQKDGKTGRPAIRISFIDTGTGISREHAKNIFEPFFSTKGEKGTGLGLWISKGIVSKHEGRIRARSLQLSRGPVTCFAVILPAAGAEGQGDGNGQHEESEAAEQRAVSLERAG